MLLPYNVDRTTRRVPWATYSLMAANTFIFLLTILVANFALSSDRIEGQREIAALVQNDLPGGFPQGIAGSASDINLDRYLQYKAMIIASQSLETTADTKRLYVIEHAYDSFVAEPHYSILNAFAYRPNDPSAFQKLLTLFTAMFLHGSLEHLLGNMLFLWIFGRAIEEFLGRKFYLSTYLISGVAATLLQHIMTQIFAPSAMGVPNLGASGAIAGVLGLFAVRFYRTKVRIFYLFGWGIWAFFIIFGLVSATVNSIIGQALVSTLVGIVAAGCAVFVYGRGNSWGAFRIPSVWMIGIWIVCLNIAPALWEMLQSNGRGGVAYWAHLGGLLCGAAYALAIGGVDEGKTEYALEDAQTALQNSSNIDAIQRAGALLQKNADNPAAHEVAAQGYDQGRNFELAAHHYIKALEGYWKSGERDAAARLYSTALFNHPHLKLRPALLLSLASHYGQGGLWDQSAGALTRIVEEYAQAPEAEIALLRAAQLWMKQYDDPAEALRMMEMFRGLFPMSQWQTQAQGLEKAARDSLARKGNQWS